MIYRDRYWPRLYPRQCGGQVFWTAGRGFLYAGTRTIVASLWQADDRATSDLMTAFYRSLGKGLFAWEALRAAQREQLEKQPHPFYWAAFQLTGSP